MKKLLLIGIVLGVIILIPNTQANELKIPDEAIRIRVIANSDSKEDQTIKAKVRKNLENSIYSLLKNTTNIYTARTIITENMDAFDDTVFTTLKENNQMIQYNISFGENYFPKKEYKGIIYEAGFYESLVVTLGNGNGNNWWCVLFPPLCLLEAEENEDIEEVEYKFFVKKIIDKFWTS